MSETGSPETPKGPTAQTFKHLRHQIRDKMPQAARPFAQSGTQPTGRQLINSAGELLRQEIESETDPLTQLPNLRGYIRRSKEAIDRARTGGYSLAVASVDANGLKDVNDSQGHDAGDRYLREIAKTLSDSIRSEDMVARTGGDEFRVILQASDAEGANVWKKRADELLTKRKLSASIGVVPMDTEQPEVSFQKADKSMYEEKRRHNQGKQPR